MLNSSAYLARINYRGPTEPSADTLRALHRAHMLAVPFENLDIHLGRPILCDEAAFLHKIINQRRGGFCYELNGAFAALLDALGFHVTLLSARANSAISLRCAAINRPRQNRTSRASAFVREPRPKAASPYQIGS